MIRRTVKLLWRGAVIGFLAYAFFFARLGNRTPFQHVMRIAHTEEAQELGHEVGVATERITRHIGDQVYEASQAPLDEAPAHRADVDALPEATTEMAALPNER